MLNFGDTNRCYRRKCNVSACRSGKNVIARTNNYSKSDSGKGSMKQKPKCASFENKIHIGYRQNHLRHMYILFALGLISKAKDRERLVEYRL